MVAALVLRTPRVPRGKRASRGLQPQRHDEHPPTRRGPCAPPVRLRLRVRVRVRVRVRPRLVRDLPGAREKPPARRAGPLSLRHRARALARARRDGLDQARRRLHALACLPRVPLAHAPPDLERLFGGGKVRKLELYFGEARAQGKRRIITSGGVGSNRALAVALLGKALGFSVRLHLTPQPSSSLRVWFDAGKPHPAQHPGLRTTQVAIPANAFLARAAKKPFHYYWDVVNQSAE